MSINKAQASALAEGFLDSLGSKDGFQPKETLTELFTIAGEFVEDAQNNLNATNTNASGKLSSSIIANEPVQEGHAVKVEIEMLLYGLFVNKGVKGTKSGNSNADYKFKGDYPSKKMVDSIREWSKLGKQSTSNTNRKKTISRNEQKNASIGDIDNAYAAARSILQHGIVATGFLDKAEMSTKQRMSNLGKALEIDVVTSITE